MAQEPPRLSCPPFVHAANGFPAWYGATLGTSASLSSEREHRSKPRIQLVCCRAHFSCSRDQREVTAVHDERRRPGARRGTPPVARDRPVARPAGTPDRRGGDPPERP